MDEQRTDPIEFPIAPHQRGATPVGMGRGGEDAFFEDVFPIARELTLGDHVGADRAAAATIPRDDDRSAFGQIPGSSQQHGRQAEGAQGLYQAESRCLVVSDDMCGDSLSLVGGQPDFVGLGDEIADGEN